MVTTMTIMMTLIVTGDLKKGATGVLTDQNSDSTLQNTNSQNNLVVNNYNEINNTTNKKQSNNLYISSNHTKYKKKTKTSKFLQLLNPIKKNISNQIKPTNQKDKNYKNNNSNPKSNNSVKNDIKKHSKPRNFSRRKL